MRQNSDIQLLIQTATNTVIAELFVRVKISYSSVGELSYAIKFSYSESGVIRYIHL